MQTFYKELQEVDIRGFLDDRDEKIGRKIRDAEVQKVPYMLNLGTMTVEEFKAYFKIVNESADKKILVHKIFNRTNFFITSIKIFEIKTL